MNKSQIKAAKEMENQLLMAEAVRQHYMSLEGAGPAAQEEAEFFLNWHYDNCEGFQAIAASRIAAEKVAVRS